MLRRVFGFTLAEVLITLGIIGVVAAITIPALINKASDIQNAAKWKKEYSTISNIFNKVTGDGLPTVTRYTQTGGESNGISEEFINEFLQNVKVTSACENGTREKYPRCDRDFDLKKQYKFPWAGFSGYSTTSFYAPLGSARITTSKKLNNYNFGTYAFLLSDGAAVYFGGLWNGPWVVVDVNNFTGGPNVIGRDVFAAQILIDNQTKQYTIKPLGAKGTADWNNPESGASGCDKKIGKQISNTIYEVAGAGCSAKYIYDRK